MPAHSYISMPWAPRLQDSPSPPSSAGTAMVSSASSNASNNSNILIEQLQAAHAAIRDLERQLKDNQCIAGRRVADVKRDGQQCLNEHQQDFSERRNCRAALPPTFISSRGDDQNDDTSETPVIETLIQELIVSRSAQKKTTIRNDKLRQELVQFRKRDNAVRDVFLSVYRREFRTEKELRKEADRLEGWKNKVQQKYRNLRSDQKRLACDQLKFEEKQMILRTQQAPRDASEDAINYFSINPKYDRAQMRPLGEVNPWSAGKISRHFAMGEPLDIWDGKPEQFHKIQKLLRKHDYYAGWLDAMRANDHQKTTAMQSMRIKVDFVKNINGGTTNYLYDRSHPRNPMNAGLNVGLLFGWSALCEEHNVPEHDVRLDDRIWKRKDLERIATEDHFGDSDFWVGVTMGTEKLRLLFELKMKSNKWNHHEDPDQMEHMQPDAMPPRHKWEEQPPPFGQGTVRIF